MNYIPKVFIIIINWNGLQDTLECLASVFKMDYSKLKVIVVDNGSSDDSVAVIRKIYPQVILIENKKNLGYSGGNNIGMRYAIKHAAQYMWLLNNDTVVEVDAVSKLVDAAECHPKVGQISPVIYYYHSPDKIQFCGSYVDWDKQSIVIPRDKHLDIDKNFRSGANVCLWGTALFIRKNVVEEIGYLNEDFFAYWEDTEYSLRVLNAGYRNLLCTSTKVYHKTTPPRIGTLGRSIHYFYYMTRNQFFLRKKYFKKRGKLFFWGNYFSDVIMTATHCKQCSSKEAEDACLDGAWAALLNAGGQWDKSIRMPLPLKKVFYFLSSWHPYFWTGLFKGDVLEILLEARKRISIKL